MLAWFSIFPLARSSMGNHLNYLNCVCKYIQPQLNLQYCHILKMYNLFYILHHEYRLTIKKSNIDTNCDI